MKFFSTQKLYKKIAKGEIGGFTVPAFNLRILTFETARALFRAAKKEKAGAFIIELAPSEMGYTDQTPQSYVNVVLEAAKKENFKGPLFFQGDHFKLNIKNLKVLIKKAIKAGFYNIDIDGSCFENLQKNARETAYFSFFIRKHQPKNIQISIGGEVSKIGGKNTTEREFEEFLKIYEKEKKKYGKFEGLIKIAVQTGSSHGGEVLPTGKLKQIHLDFKILKTLSEKAKKYGLAGVVQHGGSTLPEKYFKEFPKIGVLEIHLATLFQNIVLDNEYFPQDLKEKMYFWLEKNFKTKKEKGMTQVQFFYKFRKYALGKFKKEISKIPSKNKDKISQALEEKFLFFFKSLNVSQTEKFIKKLYF